MPDDHVSIITRFLRVLKSMLEGRGVIHVGVHQGQEVEQYLAHDCERIMLVEGNPDACLRKRIFAARVSYRLSIRTQCRSLHSRYSSISELLFENNLALCGR